MKKSNYKTLKTFPLLLTFNISLFTYFAVFSQGAAINTTGTTAHSSAILDVSSTSAGMLIPRMTKTQRNAIGSPAEGLLIYQTDDTVGFWYRSTGVWKLVGSGAGSAIANGTAAGNTLYWDGNQWVESSNIYNAGGSVGIGTNNPDQSAAFEIKNNTKGTLITRMTTAERNAIQNPAEGLQIINTDCKTLEIYFNNSWLPLNLSSNVPGNVVAGNNTTNKTEIVWNWQSTPSATGYKYNTINDYNTAIDNGINTIYSQNGLICETIYNLYVWAYNNCGNSIVTVLSDTTSACWTCSENITDNRDGISYQTVQIGNQCWMKENLKYLPSVVGPATGDATNKYYYVYGYNGTDVLAAKSQNNYNTYGVLYNWPAVMDGFSSSSNNPSGVKGVCPIGWHVPSDAEWKQLEMYLGMTQAQADATDLRGTDEGGKLKESGTSHWISPNTGATNLSGFTAIPSGYRDPNGNFYDFGNGCFFWSTTEGGSLVWRRILSNLEAKVNRSLLDKGRGYSMRCIKD